MIHKLVFTITALLLSLPMLGQQRDTTAVEEFDWEPVMEAIIWHESKGNPRARCGIYVGVMQIAPILVRECNDILKQRGSSKRFTLDDRYSEEKSKEMFKVIMSKYNPENDIDNACWLSAGGIRYNIKKTQPFVDWVHRFIETHKKE
jgi:hypothetical protein